MLNKIILGSFLTLSIVAFSGCAKINDGIADGIAYTAHTITGVPYPKKTGKIYLESTTLEDTKHLTPQNAQLNGFDNVVINDVMQCDSLPELTDALTQHGWEITNNKNEADYQVSISTVYCGYPKRWLSESSRRISLKDRIYYKAVLGSAKKYNWNIDKTKVVEEFSKHSDFYDVTKFGNFRNHFAYKYNEAPDEIKHIRNSFSADAIGAGANASQYNPNVGAAVIALGVISSIGGPPEYSGYETEVKIYNPETKKTDLHYFDGRINGGDKYSWYYYHADTFASGIFYK